MKIGNLNNFTRVEGKAVPKFETEGSFNAVCKVLGAKYVEDVNRDNEPMNYIELSFDIAEGVDTGIYQRKYDFETENLKPGEKAGWKGKIRIYTPTDDKSNERFNRILDNFYNSNEKFDFTGDTNDFKGMLIGVKFRAKYYEFEGKNGYFPEPKYLCSVERVRNGKEKVLDVYIPDEYKTSAPVKYDPNKPKVDINAVLDDEDLPWN